MNMIHEDDIRSPKSPDEHGSANGVGLRVLCLCLEAATQCRLTIKHHQASEIDQSNFPASQQDTGAAPANACKRWQVGLETPAVVSAAI